MRASPAEGEGTGRGERERPHHRLLLVLTSRVDRIRALPGEQHAELVFGRVRAGGVEQIRGQAHDLVDPHRADVHLGETDRAHAVIAAEVSDVVSSHDELEPREAMPADVDPLSAALARAAR